MDFKNVRKWGFNALIIYTVLSFVGAGINQFGHTLAVDADGFEIAANIITSTQGFFTGLMGYGDFFEYSGFHLIPFILGGLVWIIVAVVLAYASRNKIRLKDKLIYMSKILMLFGVAILVLSLNVTALTFLVSGDSFSILLLVFLAVLYIPVLVIALILRLISNIIS